MGYANDLLSKIEALSLEEELAAALKGHEVEIADANRYQMREGKDREGNFMPPYSDDPFFKGDIKRIENYIKYKRRKSPSRTKPPWIRDYYINGFTHDRVETHLSGLEVITTTGTEWNENLESSKALGINPDSSDKIWNDWLQNEYVKRIKDKTGL